MMVVSPAGPPDEPVATVSLPKHPARLANAAIGVSVPPRRIAFGLLRRHEVVGRRSIERPTDRSRHGRHSVRQPGSKRQTRVRRRDVRNGGADRRRAGRQRGGQRSASASLEGPAGPCRTRGECATDDSKRRSVEGGAAANAHSTRSRGQGTRAAKTRSCVQRTDSARDTIGEELDHV